jgi:hypothetical protein
LFHLMFTNMMISFLSVRKVKDIPSFTHSLTHSATFSNTKQHDGCTLTAGMMVLLP